MSPLEPSNPTIADSEKSNIAEAQEKDLIAEKQKESFTVWRSFDVIDI